MWQKNMIVKLFFILLIIPDLAYASEVVLKSGQKLEGKIIEQTDKYVKFDAGVGVPMTYYNDEISTIDGQKITPPTAPLVQTKKLEDENQSEQDLQQQDQKSAKSRSKISYSIQSSRQRSRLKMNV